MKRIMIDKSRCMGCLNCTLACMLEHSPAVRSIYELDLEDQANEERHYLTLDQHNMPTPIFCRHCDEPECVAACMSGAMTKDPETGLVMYHEEQCAECLMCVMSCPYGVLKPGSHPGSKVLRCDLCPDRDTPRCVENCPTEALRVVEVKRS